MSNIPIATYPVTISSGSSTSSPTTTTLVYAGSSEGNGAPKRKRLEFPDPPPPEKEVARAPRRDLQPVPTKKSWRDQGRGHRVRRAATQSKKHDQPPHASSNGGDGGGGGSSDHQVITMYSSAPKKHRSLADAYGESSHPLLTAAGQVLPATRSSLHLLHARFTATYVLLVVTFAVLGLVFGGSPAITAPLLLVGLFPAILAGISFGALMTGNDIREHSQGMLFTILASPLRALLMLNGLALVSTGLYLGNILFAIRGNCLLYQATHCLLDDTSGIVMLFVTAIALLIHSIAIIYYARIPGVLLNAR